MNHVMPPPDPLTSGIPIRNLWYMLLYAWNEVRLRDRWAAEVESAPHLDALLAIILTNLMHQRLRLGIGHDYRQHQALIRGVRGRVDFTCSLRRLAFQHGQASCRFQTYSPNIARNQIVRSTLARLALVGDFGNSSKSESLRHQVRALVRDLAPIDLIELTPEFIRREQLRRHDSDYRVMLAICHLIAQRQMPCEMAGQEQLPFLDREAMTLYRVFEKFVANFYQMHLSVGELRRNRLSVGLSKKHLHTYRS